jgi:transposase
MSKSNGQQGGESRPQQRARYTQEFREEVVQMHLDGHSAASIAQRLGLSGPNLVYSWKRQLIGKAGKTASMLDNRVSELEAELRRVERERDILKKALAIFGRDE